MTSMSPTRWFLLLTKFTGFSLKVQRRTRILALNAVSQFRAAKFDEAINTFIDLDFNPAKAAALYPESGLFIDLANHSIFKGYSKELKVSRLIFCISLLLDNRSLCRSAKASLLIFEQQSHPEMVFSHPMI